MCHKIRMKFAKKCYKLRGFTSQRYTKKEKQSSNNDTINYTSVFSNTKVFLRLHISNWERRNNAIELIQRWWRGEKIRYDMWIMRLNIIASGSFKSWKQYSDEVNDKTSRSKN